MAAKTPGHAFWDTYRALHPIGEHFAPWEEIAPDVIVAIEAGAQAAMRTEMEAHRIPVLPTTIHVPALHVEATFPTSPDGPMSTVTVTEVKS